MAHRLAWFFGTLEEFRINLQDQYVLYKVRQKRWDVLTEIKPYMQMAKA